MKIWIELNVLFKNHSGVILYSMHESAANMIHAKPLHNHDTSSVHFYHFYCTEICDKLSRDLAMGFFFGGGGYNKDPEDFVIIQ